MIDRIRLRRDTSEDWLFYNPILASGEPGIELDTNRFKVGNGVIEWNDLPYMLGNLSGLVLKIGSNNATAIQWEVGDVLNIVGSGDTQVQYNDLTNNIIIYSSGTLPPISNQAIISGLGYIPQPTGSYASGIHSHIISDVSGLQTVLNSKQPSGSYANLSHFHQLTDISGLVGSLNSKQPLGSYASADHNHTLFISNGINNVISYNSNESLKILGSGVISIGFNDSTNSIIIGSSGAGAGGESFGSVLSNQVLFKNDDNNIVGNNGLIYQENDQILKVNNLLASGNIEGIIDGGLI